MTKIVEADTHGLSTYSNYGCRCEVCRSAWAGYISDRRKQRRAQRVEIGGRMTATQIPPEKHGTEAVYSNYSCRCEACTEAQRTGQARRKKARQDKQEQTQGETS